MIGNDVVDINQSRLESNRHRKGFLEKLFSVQEQEIIHKATDAEQMTWRLWSMKEAAYKIYNRRTGIRAFVPLSLCCTIYSDTNGQVSCKGVVYYTRTMTNDDLIHTIAVCNINDFALIYEPEAFQVAKDEQGLPYAKSKDGSLHPASISHHGKYLKIVGLQKEMAAGKSLKPVANIHAIFAT